MSTPVPMPKLGESVVEGTVARWLKATGERVTKLEPLLEISTDKIDTEIPAPADGVLLEILVAEGDTVAVGTVLAVIGAPGEQTDTKDETRNTNPAAAATSSAPVTPHPSDQRPSGRNYLSPVVNKLVNEHKLDLAQINGSGLGGRITKKDVSAFIETRRQEDKKRRREEDSVLQPLSAMRRAIAQHMVLSKQTSPHVTTIFEVDMAAVVRHREAHKVNYASQNIHLTFTPYFVAATAIGLRSVPLANARFSDKGLIFPRAIHIGVAVATHHNGENGLIVPVIRAADQQDLAGLARAVSDLSVRARQGTLAPAAVHGGTFTITNHGVGGSLAGTPIINQPQSAILGVGAIVKRPVVISASGQSSLLPSADDALVIRPMCYLSLSFDHRVLDGASADEFLTVIKQRLENWPIE